MRIEDLQLKREKILTTPYQTKHTLVVWIWPALLNVFAPRTADMPRRLLLALVYHSRT
jgi:hypothetical protein